MSLLTPPFAWAREASLLASTAGAFVAIFVGLYSARRASPATPQSPAAWWVMAVLFAAMTGAGDHPLFLKLLHRAARYVDEPGLPPPSPKPPPGNGRAPSGGLRSIYAQRGVN